MKTSYGTISLTSSRKNNVALLADHPLTDQEKRQIKNQLNFVSYYGSGQVASG